MLAPCRVLALPHLVGLPVLAFSAEEILWALLRHGFTVVERDDQRVLLRREYRRVTLPVVSVLASDTVTALLRDAGLSYSELLDLLGEAPTDRVGSPASSGVRLKRHL